MRKNIVAGNWKMNKTLQEGLTLAKGIEAALAGKKVNCDVIIGTPFIHLASVAQAIDTAKIGVAAENCADKASGAYTGEVSAAMVASTGAKYVILGHSERRTLFAETDEMVAEKVKRAFENGVMPIVCVGETLAEREAGRTIEVVSRQLKAVLDAAGIAPLVAGALAYEPVWAIGTGKSASPEDAQAVHAALREVLAQVDTEAADAVRILYGGSVKATNAKALFAQKDIDGALVGGASLKAEDFLAICQCAECH